MRQSQRPWGRRNGNGPRRIASVALWLCVVWGTVGATCGGVAVIAPERCPPDWEDVTEQKDDAEAKDLYPDWRLHDALMLEHCEKIEDMIE